MANYATNIFYARTENKADLDKIEAFLDDTFDGFVNRHSDSVDAEFTSRWVYPEEEIDRLIVSSKTRITTTLIICFGMCILFQSLHTEQVWGIVLVYSSWVLSEPLIR